MSLLSCGIAAATVAVTACGQGSGVQVGSASVGSASVAPQAAVQPLRHSNHGGDRARMLAIGDAFAACEQRIERAPGHVPTMAIVGASYTAGVGPNSAALSWASDLARNLHWDAVIYGDPGAGYTRSGTDGLGPMTRLLGAERLPELSPALVLVQAGYDDGRVPPGLERQQVTRTIDLIRAEAPHAWIGVVTVFTSPARPVPGRLYGIDGAIVSATADVDPNAIIMDPLTGQWTYQHADGGRGLHPTAAGDAWIAEKVAAILHAHGIGGRPATTTAAAAAPITCELGVPGSRLDSDLRA